jgi:hypothetical protein
MKFNNLKRAPQLLPFGTIFTRHRYNNVRLHPFVHRILSIGEQRLRDRYPGSGIGSDDFTGPALAEFERRRLIHRVEARIYLPMFIEPKHFKRARAEGGTPIWLPSSALEELGDEVWKEVRPKWKNKKVVWS